VEGFEEKPSDPKPLPNDSNHPLVSIGVYVFNLDTLLSALVEDAGGRRSCQLPYQGYDPPVPVSFQPA
jgi:glucose-1-phosphate adenylyltransferase